MILGLGEKIKALREQSGLSQGQVASQLNINRSVVSLYESNDRAPTYPILLGLAEIFHVSTDYLLGAGEFKEKVLQFNVEGLTNDQVNLLSEMIGKFKQEFLKSNRD